MRRKFYASIVLLIISILVLSGCNLPFKVEVVPQNQATEAQATSAPAT